MNKLQEILTILKYLLNSILAIPKTIYKLLAWLLKILMTLLDKLRKKKRPKKRDYKKCMRLPPGVSRWPDPCIYSQKYLMARGISVTWNNPDIQITDVLGNQVSSGNLQADTNYIVNATIHNASFDPAIGVQVDCTVRKWGIETEDRTPIELDNNGLPVIKIIHIVPWGSQIASFNWHTPAVQREHICIEVKCSHPNDREIENNVGQENTTVIGAASGSSFKIIVPFFNALDIEQEFKLWADEYKIQDKEVVLDLNKVGAIKTSRMDAINPSKIILPSKLKKGFMNKSQTHKLSTYAYASNFRESNKNLKTPLHPDWKIQLKDKINNGDNTWLVKIPSKTTLDFEVEIKIPLNATNGTTKTINISGRDSIGLIIGGVTIHIKIN